MAICARFRANLLSTDQRDPSSWHSQYETAGGGELMHNGTHLFDVIRLYAGDPEWVFATVERGNKAITIEDLAGGAVPNGQRLSLLF